MNAIYLVLFVCTLTFTLSVTGMSTFMSIANAQPLTTSDLPYTIGNESTSDMGLTNNTVPVQNATTTYAGPPL